MDFELPEELRMLQETVRRFVDREIIPNERDSYDGHSFGVVARWLRPSRPPSSPMSRARTPTSRPWRAGP